MVIFVINYLRSTAFLKYFCSFIKFLLSPGFCPNLLASLLENAESPDFENFRFTISPDSENNISHIGISCPLAQNIVPFFAPSAIAMYCDPVREVVYSSKQASKMRLYIHSHKKTLSTE